VLALATLFEATCPTANAICDDATCSTEEVSFSIIPGSSYGITMTYTDVGGGGGLTAVSGTDGQVMVPAGSAAAPALVVMGTNTGFSFGIGTLGISTAGVSGSYSFGNTAFNVLGEYIYSSTAILSLGSAVTSTHALGTGAVGVGGALEVDGAAYFDSTSEFSGASTWKVASAFNDAVRLFFGTGHDAQFLYSVVNTPDTLYLGVGADSNSFIIGETADYTTDWALALQTNPTLAIQSADATSPTERLTLAYIGASDYGQIGTGAGFLKLAPAAAGVILPTIDAAVPAEPVACAAGTVGTLTYVNDNNDGAAAELCICAGITNDATFDWVQVKDMTTACSFF
jgi:hypothetical protein